MTSKRTKTNYFKAISIFLFSLSVWTYACEEESDWLDVGTSQADMSIPIDDTHKERMVHQEMGGDPNNQAETLSNEDEENMQEIGQNFRAAKLVSLPSTDDGYGVAYFNGTDWKSTSGFAKRIDIDHTGDIWAVNNGNMVWNLHDYHWNWTYWGRLLGEPVDIGSGPPCEGWPVACRFFGTYALTKTSRYKLNRGSSLRGSWGPLRGQIGNMLAGFSGPYEPRVDVLLDGEFKGHPVVSTPQKGKLYIVENYSGSCSQVGDMEGVIDISTTSDRIYVLTDKYNSGVEVYYYEEGMGWEKAAPVLPGASGGYPAKNLGVDENNNIYVSEIDVPDGRWLWSYDSDYRFWKYIDDEVLDISFR